MTGLVLNWLRLTPNRTNLGLFKPSFSIFWFVKPNWTNVGLFKISFSTFWLSEPKCTETYLKKSQIFPIWGQSEPIRMANLTPLPCVCLSRSLLVHLDLFALFKKQKFMFKSAEVQDTFHQVSSPLH